MPLNDETLERVVSDWNGYVTRILEQIDSLSLLKRKNLSMYMALGVTHSQALADRIVNDYVSSSVENTMGHLYELVFAELGSVKVPNEMKKERGYRGLDFIHVTPTEIRLIDLAAAANTKNASARTKSRQDMADAAAHWEDTEKRRTDDNPVAPTMKQIVRIWAVARGSSAMSQPDEILRLRGNTMWKYFGAGDDCLGSIAAALACNPITDNAFRAAVSGAVVDLMDFLRDRGFARPGGHLAWPPLLSTFP